MCPKSGARSQSRFSWSPSRRPRRQGQPLVCHNQSRAAPATRSRERPLLTPPIIRIARRHGNPPAIRKSDWVANEERRNEANGVHRWGVSRRQSLDEWKYGRGWALSTEELNRLGLFVHNLRRLWSLCRRAGPQNHTVPPAQGGKLTVVAIQCCQASCNGRGTNLPTRRQQTPDGQAVSSVLCGFSAGTT